MVFIGYMVYGTWYMVYVIWYMVYTHPKGNLVVYIVYGITFIFPYTINR